IRIGYPGPADEKAILRGGGALAPEALSPVLEAAEVLELQEQADRVRAEESVLDYLMALVSATRTSPQLRLGVSPRGALSLRRAGALSDGRDFRVPDDLKILAVPALAHRVLLRGAPGVETDAEAVLTALRDTVPVPR